ncbi:MAG: hypothetical protein Q9217_000047 [Psora testacea]
MVVDASITLRDRRNIAAGVSEIYLRGLHERGTEHFRERDYKAALQCFDEAVKQDAEAPLPILDKRAATYVKLGDLHHALFDAGKMIRQDQSSAILSEALAPPRAMDPFKTLPEEIAGIVFALLDFKDVVNLSRVCTSWRFMVIHNSSLWTNIDFISARKAIPSSTVREYIKRSQGKVKRLATKAFKDDQKAALKHVIQRCRELQELYLHSGFVGSSLLGAMSCAYNLRTIIASSLCETSLETVTQLLGCCSNLERAEFCLADARSSPSDWKHHLPKLVCLRLDNQSVQCSKLPLSELLAKIPNIRSLRLRGFGLDEGHKINDFSVVPHLAHLDIAKSSIRSFRLPPSLSELNVNDVYFLGSNIGQPSADLKDQYLPRLVRLSLSGWALGIRAFLHTWLNPNRGNLRQLDLSRQKSITGPFLSELIEEGFLENIEELKLNQCDIGDEIVALLARRARRLERLDLEWTRVTGIGVKELVTNLRDTLRYLGLDSCRSTSIDAVQLARSMGLTVSFRFPDDARKGKKVRSV